MIKQGRVNSQPTGNLIGMFGNQDDGKGGGKGGGKGNGKGNGKGDGKGNGQGGKGGGKRKICPLCQNELSVECILNSIMLPEDEARCPHCEEHFTPGLIEKYAKSPDIQEAILEQ